MKFRMMRTWYARSRLWYGRRYRNCSCDRISIARDEEGEAYYRSGVEDDEDAIIKAEKRQNVKSSVLPKEV